jgi:hypothetical protein
MKNNYGKQLQLIFFSLNIRFTAESAESAEKIDLGFAVAK